MLGFDFLFVIIPNTDVFLQAKSSETDGHDESIWLRIIIVVSNIPGDIVYICEPLLEIVSYFLSVLHCLMMSYVPLPMKFMPMSYSICLVKMSEEVVAFEM